MLNLCFILTVLFYLNNGLTIYLGVGQTDAHSVYVESDDNMQKPVLSFSHAACGD